MSARAWSAIVSVYEDASRLVTTTLASPGQEPDLDTLRVRLRRRLDDLMAELSPPLAPEEAAEILVPLVFLLDEQIQGRLARAGPDVFHEWPLLQRDLFPEGDGGDAFYERAAAFLRTPAPSPLVLGAYLFCLQAGFQGRLIDHPSAIPEWKARIAERIPTLAPGPAPAAAPPGRKARSRAFYVLATLSAIVAWQIALALVARAVPMSPVRAPAGAPQQAMAPMDEEGHPVTVAAWRERPAPPDRAPENAPAASRPEAPHPAAASPPSRASTPRPEHRARRPPAPSPGKTKKKARGGHKARHHEGKQTTREAVHGPEEATSAAPERRRHHSRSTRRKKQSP